MAGNKSSMMVLVLVACMAGTSIATGLIVWGVMKPAAADVESVPTSIAPDASLTIVDDLTGTGVEVSISEISGMILSDPSKKKVATEEIGGKDRTLVGINPIDLFDAKGFWDPWNVSLVSGDAGNPSETINVTDMYFSDDEFDSQAVGNPIFIAIACDGKWLTESPIQNTANYGNFSVFGSTRFSSQRIRNLNTLNITSHWQVKVVVDNVTEFVIDRTNITTNQETATYGYQDNASGKSWNNTYIGRTVADIVDETSASGSDYNLTIIAADGWGSKWVYNNTDIESGLSEDKRGEIGEPPENLTTDGLLMTLYYQAGDPDEFPSLNTVGSGGPFKTVLPGQTRNKYMKLVTEINIIIV
ncbi:MAG: hypothetical protein ACTSUE_19265 [Promethearchaeota archaeon]